MSKLQIDLEHAIEAEVKAKVESIIWDLYSQAEQRLRDDFEKLSDKWAKELSAKAKAQVEAIIKPHIAKTPPTNQQEPKR